MKQIGIRMAHSHYAEIKNFGRILSMSGVFPIELNDSELFSLLINYAWKKKKEKSVVSLETGIADWESIETTFKQIFGVKENPFNFLQEMLTKEPVSKTLVLSDDTYDILTDATKVKPGGSITNAVKILTLSVIRDMSSNVDIMTWYLAFGVYTMSLLEYTAGKVKLSSLKGSLIHFKVPNEISVFSFDKENFTDIMKTLLGLNNYAKAKNEAFKMEDVGKSIAENFMGNFVNIARGGGKYRYPKGISPQTSMATKFWAKALPYMASRKLLTTALIFYALRKKKNNMVPIIEVQETEILDILVESLVNNELNLAEDYNDAYRMFMAWMNIFENYVEKNSHEQ